jgi:hypothetical protein
MYGIHERENILKYSASNFGTKLSHALKHGSMCGSSFLNRNVNIFEFLHRNINIF